MMSALMFTWMSCGTESRQEDSTEAAEEQNEQAGNDQTEDDAKFAVEAAESGMFEVQLGTLALTKASSPQVKQFAQMMVDDHTKANNELKTAAQQKNITLPTTLGNEKQRDFEKFGEKTGAEFDKEYVDQMVKSHRETINKFEDQAEDGKDPELKAWASSTLTTLRHHLEEAERLQETVKNNNNNNQ